MNDEEKNALILIKKIGMDGYELLEGSLKDSVIIKKNIIIMQQKDKIKLENLMTFSTFKRIETELFFFQIYDDLSEDTLIHQNLQKRYFMLNDYDKNVLREFCLDVAEFPEKYFSYSDDLKFYPEVTAYVKGIVNDYREFFKKYKSIKHHDVYDRTYDLLPIYDATFEDIENEIEWARNEYDKRNKMLSKKKNRYK